MVDEARRPFSLTAFRVLATATTFTVLGPSAGFWLHYVVGYPYAVEGDIGLKLSVFALGGLFLMPFAYWLYAMPALVVGVMYAVLPKAWRRIWVAPIIGATVTGAYQVVFLIKGRPFNWAFDGVVVLLAAVAAAFCATACRKMHLDHLDGRVSSLAKSTGLPSV